MIYYHVHCIVEEVPDREAHEDVTGVGKLADEVILHLRSLPQDTFNLLNEIILTRLKGKMMFILININRF